MANDFTGGYAATAPPGTAEFTGRYLLLCRDAGNTGVPQALRDRVGLRIASASDFTGGAVDMAALGGADGIYFDKLGVAVTSSAPDQLQPLVGSSVGGGVLAVERERMVYILAGPPRRDHAPELTPRQAAALEPWLGLGADDLLCSLAMPAATARLLAEIDEAARTWGLVCTRAIESSMTGRGVRVAVLDTGFDLDHPDFAGRPVVHQSFIEGETAQDGQGHGTHCVGTALGSDRPASLPRYGVAPAAEIFVGKVLSNRGSGKDGSILAGINWAITNRCRIVSMSLGMAARPGQSYSQVYETVAQRALAANTLLIAAAGNESNRPEVINPVGHPANCPSIMAVGAVDVEMRIARFSTRSADAHGGRVDIVAPGVEIYSTTPMPERYGRKNGTSMACPHVAGIAALYAEARPNASAQEIWQLLVTNAKPLNLESEDIGAGLVQAPV